MLDDKCGYLRLTCEATDDGLYDIFVGYMTGNHAKAREMFREKLRDLKAQGMEYLVIDLRNNQGGYDEIANALCDLFAAEDMDHYAVGATGPPRSMAYTVMVNLLTLRWWRLRISAVSVRETALPCICQNFRM